ncbi:hypothetical protein TRFO_40560 [Tritrichomonas foetus]|uniref:Phosphatidylinositol-specific phospholipase C X domain-containing protein n=1 Tax=Tritrichomonas foetus TaxID=1144522 RepID=A0A1J4J136_9EUKA|nr:hypothetical protein TRFO_40560 [Tritrichomonas foetus]|eukprot:OHS93130.1 hypothetical protein TRFO_40560 [Tritrichomonas foetus]
MNLKKMFVPTQLGARFTAKIDQSILPKVKSNSPPPIRTTANFCDHSRRRWGPRVDLMLRSKSPQPKRMPRVEPCKYYRLNNWMEDLGYLIQDKKITEIKIPGTHDSATYAITKKSKAAKGEKAAKLTTLVGDPKQWTVCQTKSIRTQLKYGARFLDLRASYEDDERFYLHHGLKAKSLAHELKIIHEFLQRHPHEMIIIKIKPTSTCATFLRNLQFAIHKLLGNKHIVMKSHFVDGSLQTRMPSSFTLRECAGKVLVIIDARDFVEGGKDSPEITRNPFLFGNTVLHSKWPNKRNYDELVSALIASQPNIDCQQLYCLHFTFTANAKYVLSHMNQDLPVHDIFTMTKKLEEKKKPATGHKDNWHYLISLLSARKNAKRDININVVDFLNGMKSHRLIFLNYPESKVPPLPPPIKRD